jgi:hypothetical protein
VLEYEPLIEIHLRHHRPDMVLVLEIQQVVSQRALDLLLARELRFTHTFRGVLDAIVRGWSETRDAEVLRVMDGVLPEEILVALVEVVGRGKLVVDIGGGLAVAPDHSFLLATAIFGGGTSRATKGSSRGSWVLAVSSASSASRRTRAAQSTSSGCWFDGSGRCG